MPPIVAVLPTSLPQVAVHERIVDSVFRTADGCVLHLEFQGAAPPDLYRFAHCALDLGKVHDARVRTVGVYLHPIRRPPTRLHVGAVRFHCENRLVAAQDGAAVWERLEARSRTRAPWTPDALLGLAYAPFLRHPHLSRAERARQAARWAVDTPGPAALPALGVVMGLTSPLLTPAEVQHLKEVMRMSSVLQELLEEMAAERIEQAIAQGKAEGQAEGQAAVLATILAARFGPLPTAVLAHIDRLAAAPDWDRQAAALATADSLDAVRRLVAALEPVPEACDSLAALKRAAWLSSAKDLGGPLPQRAKTRCGR